MAPGVRYQLRVVGCMSAQLTVCGSSETGVMLRDQPLQASIVGGDRTVGHADTFDLDACGANDPDEPEASCDASTGQCKSGLMLYWACIPLAVGNLTSSVAIAAGCGLSLPSTSTCAWLIEGGALVEGRYLMSVLVQKPAGESLEAAVTITVRPGAYPQASIDALPNAKQNPSSKLSLIGTTNPPAGVADGAVLDLLWSVYNADGMTPAPIDLAAVSLSGITGTNLVLDKNVLNPGATYTFELRATYNSKAAVATSSVQVNRPPYGGTFELTGFTPPAMALTTSVTLQVSVRIAALVHHSQLELRST